MYLSISLLWFKSSKFIECFTSTSSRVYKYIPSIWCGGDMGVESAGRDRDITRRIRRGWVYNSIGYRGRTLTYDRYISVCIHPHNINHIGKFIEMIIFQADCSPNNNRINRFEKHMKWNKYISLSFPQPFWIYSFLCLSIHLQTFYLFMKK